MKITERYIIISVTWLLSCLVINGQKTEFHGQAASWLTINNSDGTGIQPGLRFIPQLTLTLPAGKNLRLDGELSADGYLSYTYFSDTSDYFNSRANLYRFWLRLSGDRFEIRAGLQKINFGSASMLRPLMWFDRIDPRDPLKLTRGVYGLQGKYFFRNNANIWLWVLDGNKETKGWETIPGKQWRPEFGGRVQLPVPKGEIAFTWHNRTGEFPYDWQPPLTDGKFFPENRFGFDFKLDLGAGIWFESTVIHQKHPDLVPFTKAFTFGTDYNFNIGNGLNITAEHLIFNMSEELFSSGNSYSFTGISASIPVSVITRISTIVFYDWKGKGWYRFANISLTYDNLGINLIGFWNPRSFSLFNYGSGPNLFAGAGGQVMVVYNY